ncbi:MAG TPA: UbiA family prenyltransferase [Nitrososphaera sp.]|nr:UbiA family prenyltransferase [Nitrososphaera sp.]
MSLSIHRKQKQTTDEVQLSFPRSQLVLFQSRKKFALLYCLATVTGLFCVPGVFLALSSPDSDLMRIVQMTLPLPLASLLVTAGTYIMNDLVDADLDRANGKKRPIPSGQVSKKQAWTFVLLAFGAAVLLVALTASPISLVIVALMLTIGITYSMPKIALMKRFVVKTISIAFFYMLCALLGMTSAYNITMAMADPALVACVLLTLALMVFISSTLNDMGDIDGDKAAGRRTIPIVLGKDNTIRLTMGLAAGVLVITWIFYVVGLAAGHSSLVSSITTTAIVMVVYVTLANIRKGFHSVEFIRSQHKKLFPLQMAIHPSIIVGVMMI